ncbi:MAG: hypothetical protein QF675_07745 [SAR324 cluster bacterium]|nr:hypothetical protein [SAR324 cluster bacterium]|tara:strand:- start:323 stop:505 length:183 start_codon:yes stop_codon:yes gene_type:complete
MAAFQPIEDAGPRLAFGADDFLLVFVTAASSDIVAETPQGQNTDLQNLPLRRLLHLRQSG